MGKYIKVSPFVAEQLNLAHIRQQATDGNYILWQQDLAGVEGETLEERCQYIGGVIIDRNKGKEELKGTDDPVPVMEGSEDDLPDNLPEEPEDLPEQLPENETTESTPSPKNKKRRNRK